MVSKDKPESGKDMGLSDPMSTKLAASPERLFTPSFPAPRSSLRSTTQERSRKDDNNEDESGAAGRSPLPGKRRASSVVEMSISPEKKGRTAVDPAIDARDVFLRPAAKRLASDLDGRDPSAPPDQLGGPTDCSYYAPRHKTLRQRRRPYSAPLKLPPGVTGVLSTAVAASSTQARKNRESFVPLHEDVPDVEDPDFDDTKHDPKDKTGKVLFDGRRSLQDTGSALHPIKALNTGGNIDEYKVEGAADVVPNAGTIRNLRLISKNASNVSTSPDDEPVDQEPPSGIEDEDPNRAARVIRRRSKKHTSSADPTPE